MHGPTYIRKKFGDAVMHSTHTLGELLNSGIEKGYAEDFAEHSFLKAYIGWEIFLEDSFKSYLLGRRTDSGYKMKRYLKPKDLKHVENLISYKWTNTYERWNYIEVAKRADLFFKDYSNYSNAFTSIKTQLDDMSKIRNHIAHKSEKSKAEFEHVVRDRLHGGTVPSNITVGKFLLNTNSSSSTLIYDEYMDGLIAASKIIVP